VFGSAIATFLLAIVLTGEEYPQNPLLVTLLLAGPGLWAVKLAMSHGRPSVAREATDDAEQQKALLNWLQHEAADERDFYLASTAAFFVTSLLAVLMWFVWLETYTDDPLTNDEDESIEHSREVLLVLWSSPLITAGTHAAFAGLLSLRVALHNSYQATDSLKNELQAVVAETQSLRPLGPARMLSGTSTATATASVSGLRKAGKQAASKSKDLEAGAQNKTVASLTLLEVSEELRNGRQQYRQLERTDSRLGERSGAIERGLPKRRPQSSQLRATAASDTGPADQELQPISVELEEICLEALGPDIRQLALVQHVKKLKELSLVVRVIGCIIFAVVCVYYVTAELAYSDSHVAGAVRWALGMFLLFFVCFIWGAFRRLWQAMRESMQSLPVYRMAVSALSSDWTKAALVFAVAPVVPIFIVLSAMNEEVRRRRGLAQPAVAASAPRSSTSGSSKKAQPRRWLTSKVAVWFKAVQEWDAVSILDRVYVVGIAWILYTTCPLLLNVVLAWLRTLLTEVPFALLLVVFFLIGLGCFLLPPVPGPPVYLFGGVVLSDYCPWGFWPGTVICIMVSWLLKLTACAMQQKCIGEMLRSSTWVRQTCRVHTPLLRAIEAVLREPGFALGKITILCGGPDWPTSVGAGVLGLPLWEMLVGTLPIIFFVAPCVMTGSFYLKREESDFWLRASSMMLSATVIVCAILWVGAVWAVQQVLDRRYDELNCPRLADVQLAWLDWKQDQIKLACQTRWKDIPTLVVVAIMTGAVWLVFVGHLFYWLPSWCFGSFAVTDDIEDFRWVDGEDALFQPNGLLGLGLALGSLLCIGAAKLWASVSTSRARQQTHQRLAKIEGQWKERWIEEAYEAQDRLATTQGRKSCCHSDFKHEHVAVGDKELEDVPGDVSHQDLVKPGMNTSASTGIGIDGGPMMSLEEETPGRTGTDINGTALSVDALTSEGLAASPSDDAVSKERD